MEERWKKISGFGDYEISTNGTIRSRERTKKYKSGRTVHFKSKEKRLRKHPNNHFLMTDLVNDKGKRKTVYPHKLVAIAFIKNEHPRINKIVMHKDQDFTNNSMDNLAWASFSESIRLGFETGRRNNSNLWEKRRKKYGPQGSKRPMGRKDPLSEEDRQTIYDLRQNKQLTLAAIAEKFNCSVAHVHKTLKKMDDNGECGVAHNTSSEK
ncbi:MAG: hypothetical protein ACQERC_09850 [Bacteroidota bacterium]